MDDYSGYTTLTHHIPIDMFFFIITNPIKKLIHKYGHKNCGLRHEELCEEIKKIISHNRKIELKHMNQDGRQKWISDWDSKRNEFFNRLFEEEGFINMCFPKQKFTNIPSLNQLISKHIDFCKKKDERRATLEKTSEYSECVNYNSWIETEKKSFTREYLSNVRNFNSRTVNKYFITKEHPSGHDPRETYHRSKLNCEIYNPTSNIYKKKTVEKAPKNKSQPPRVPNIRRGSQVKDERTVTDKDSESAKTKSEESIFPKSKSHTPDSQIPSPSKTQRDGTSTVQDTPAKTEDLGSPVNKEGEKNGVTSIKSVPPINDPPTSQAEAPSHAKSSPHSPKDTSPTTDTQSVPVPTTTTPLSSTLVIVKDTISSQTPATTSSLTITSPSLLNSGSPLTSNPLTPAADAKGLDRAPQSSTTSDTLPTTHPNKSVPSTAPADSSLLQPQVPVLTVPSSVTTSEGPGTFISSSTSTTTTTVTTTTTTTTAAPTAVTTSTMSTTAEATSSVKEATSVSSSQEPPPPSAASGSKATVPITGPQQTFTQTPTSLSGGDTKGVSVPAQPDTIDNNQQTKISSAPSSKTKDLMIQPGVLSANSITTHSAYTPSEKADIQSVKIQETVSQTDTKHNISAVQIGTNKDHDPSTHLVNVDPGKFFRIKPGNDPKNNSVTLKGKNDKPNIIPEEIPSLTHIIPTLLVILAILTLLYQLYKVK
ncbi:STP1 protein [Plasmodium ovale]|uniref:STP1 protein n=1 Tax=Plasmodium ovale TaxID=36330 RepID=A0A1D3JDX2_PLAOA|nr:STP1 protein [Plasmodium ovale]